MTRPNKPAVVAGRVAVANPSPARVPALDPVLDSASHTVADALQEGRAPETYDPPADVSAERAFPVSPDAREDIGSEPADEASVREREQQTLARRIRAHLPKGELVVSLTDNRYTMISVRRETKSGRRYLVRLHHMFAEAGPTVTRALARYVAYNDRDASRLLGEYIDANQHRVRERARRSVTPKLVTRGEVHDLASIFDELNQHYFAGTIKARITWGQKSGKPQRRNSIKMGSYSVEDQLIRIHRSLDRAFVPRFFVEWVVYHEMLHQVHDIKVVNGRRQFHSREFLRDEARFERYAEARAWERTHLDELLTY